MWQKAKGLKAFQPSSLCSGVPARDRSLEVDRRAELEEPRLQNRVGRQPVSTWDERLVVAQHRRRIQDVVDVEPNVGPRPAELQDLREPEVEFVDAVAVHRA